MKKVIWLLVALGFLGALKLLPFRAQEAAELFPVKTIFITRSGREYTVDVGAGVQAIGKTLSEALERLREQSPGEVFLPTAEQVVITEADSAAVEAVAEETALRPAAGVCQILRSVADKEALGQYLEAHPSDYTILELRAALLAGEAPAIPVLRAVEGGGFRFER